MKLDKTAQLGGYPILRIRDLFRWSVFSSRAELSPPLVEKQLKVTAEAAAELVAHLVSLGYLQLLPPHERVLTRWYALLPPARSLALAKALPQLTRPKAEALLAAFLQRVAELNANPAYLYHVEQVFVFGSYLRSDVMLLNDLDVAVHITRKLAEEAHAAANQALVSQAKRRGVRFPTVIDRLAYAEVLAGRFLRGRNYSLSLHKTSDEVLLVTETKQVWGGELAKNSLGEP